MKLYIGGAFQGQEELARRENPQAEILPGFQDTIRGVLAGGGDPLAFAQNLCREKPEAVVVCCEVGCGVVPMDAGERAYREAVGRALCLLAQNADTVVRCVCGIGVRIK